MSGVANEYLGLLPAVPGTVVCGGAEHRVRWAAGELHLLDHDDPEGERILAVLGGEPPRCVAVVEAWHRCCADVSLLPALIRLADRVRPLLAGGEARPAISLVSGLTTSLSATIWQGRIPPTSAGRFGAASVREDLLLLLSTGGGLADRLAVQAISLWSARAADGAVEAAAWPALRAVLTSRVQATLAQWAGSDAADVSVDLTEGQGTASRRADERGWDISVPVGWLAQVWAPGLAVTAGRLVLGATWAGDELHLRAVDGSGARADLTVRTSAGSRIA